MDFLDVCRRLIAIDTSPAAGTLEAAQYLTEVSRELGLEPVLYTETHLGVDQGNLVVRLPEWASAFAKSTERELVLQTHLDTPDPGSYTLWSETGLSPFQATIRAGELFGLGVADCKLDFVCKLFALAAASNGEMRRVACAATFGEETGMVGAVRLMRKKAIRPSGILVGEPTAFEMVYAGKGYVSVQIEIPFCEEEKKFRDEHNSGEQTSSQSRAFIGRPAHSSDPSAGDSAIIKMLQSLVRLPSGLIVIDVDGGHNPNTVPAHAFIEIDPIGVSLDPEVERQFMKNKLTRMHRAIQNLESEFSLVQDSRFHPQHPTLNLGTIRTGQDAVRMSGCVRLPSSVPEAQFNKWIDQFRGECERIDARLVIEDYKPAFETEVEGTALGELLIGACQAAELPQTLGVLSVTNEASVFTRFGISCLAWGPGQGVGNSHTPSECVKIKDLEKATEVYQNMIQSYAEG